MARRAMTQIIKARVETPIAHKIVDVAEKDRTTVSDIVRDALAEYLDRREKQDESSGKETPIQSS